MKLVGWAAVAVGVATATSCAVNLDGYVYSDQTGGTGSGKGGSAGASAGGTAIGNRGGAPASGGSSSGGAAASGGEGTSGGGVVGASGSGGVDGSDAGAAGAGGVDAAGGSNAGGAVASGGSASGGTTAGGTTAGGTTAGGKSGGGTSGAGGATGSGGASGGRVGSGGAAAGGASGGAGTGGLVGSGGATPLATLTVTPASGFSADFGGVRTNTTAYATFTVKNTGTQAATTLALGVTGGTPFGITTPGTGACVNGAALPAGTSCTVQVAFSPTARGVANTTLGASASNATSGSLALTGKGTIAASLSWAPAPGSSANYGLVTVSAGKTQTFTLTNIGDEVAPAVAYSISSSPAYYSLVYVSGGAGCVDGADLAGGQSCDIQVKCLPSASGTVTAVLEGSFWQTFVTRIAADLNLTGIAVFN